MKAVLHGGPFDGCVAIYDEPTETIRVRDGAASHCVYTKRTEYDGNYWYSHSEDGAVLVSVSKEGTEA